MAPPWPPISADTEYPETTENPEATESPKTTKNLDTTKSKIFFVGDYAVNGSIEGALQSGLTAARQILGPRQILALRQILARELPLRS
jgi:hypothetical protein